MSKKIKIMGAGSIGNHLANASRTLGWHVDLCDVDTSALERTRTEIYPSRYGNWDEQIHLFQNNDAPVGGYDLILIGTPPNVHISLAMKALEERPKAVVIEKPICGPDLLGAQQMYERAKELGVAIYVGYDHVVGKASRIALNITKTDFLGSVRTLDVEFREHWGGIFNAHPWLSGPSDSYLGNSMLGGGASGEHSHAVNLWQHFAGEIGGGRVIEVQATLDMVNDGKVSYDRICAMNLYTENGIVGRCIQDVVTKPPRKWARIQYENGHIEWHCGREPGVDFVCAELPGKITLEQRIQKTRPDDFIEELMHIDKLLDSNSKDSPISIDRGLDTMLVIAAAHLSHSSGRRVLIDYSKGYCHEAIRTI
jgi:predicted dehydrogenase